MNDRPIDRTVKTMEVHGMAIKYDEMEYENRITLETIIIYDDERQEDYILIRDFCQIRFLQEVLTKFLKEHSSSVKYLKGKEND